MAGRRQRRRSDATPTAVTRRKTEEPEKSSRTRARGSSSNSGEGRQRTEASRTLDDTVCPATPPPTAETIFRGKKRERAGGEEGNGLTRNRKEETAARKNAETRQLFLWFRRQIWRGG
ncbi:hypothetical protein BT93_F0815 [Corymbia citriodora subsp. variegata]|nr:hypothetical protein BT93_F0815 [Corymbia citriodora subsp. variegata]